MLDSRVGIQMLVLPKLFHNWGIYFVFIPADGHHFSAGCHTKSCEFCWSNFFIGQASAIKCRNGPDSYLHPHLQTERPIPPNVCECLMVERPCQAFLLFLICSHCPLLSESQDTIRQINPLSGSQDYIRPHFHFILMKFLTMAWWYIHPVMAHQIWNETSWSE